MCIKVLTCVIHGYTVGIEAVRRVLSNILPLVVPKTYLHLTYLLMSNKLNPLVQLMSMTHLVQM